jgi:ribonucleotide monophosphatase NagD (HAD superfamily)
MELKQNEIINAVKKVKNKNGFICDMDGVIYHGNRILPGVKDFIEWLQKENKRFLFLTNSSERSQRELQDKLARMGILWILIIFIPAHWPPPLSSILKNQKVVHLSSGRRACSMRCMTLAIV